MQELLLFLLGIEQESGMGYRSRHADVVVTYVGELYVDMLSRKFYELCKPFLVLQEQTRADCNRVCWPHAGSVPKQVLQWRASQYWGSSRIAAIFDRQAANGSLPCDDRRL